MHSRPVTPDKGWAWVICLVTFFVHVTVDGVGFSFGVLFVELTEYFGSSRAVTAWIGALLFALMHGFGIVASSLTKFWGFRVVSLLGAVLATAGFSLSFLVTEIWQLFLTIGLLAGTGCGFLYFGSLLALQHWFEKRLALANGLSMAGNGIGTFAIAPLLEYLIQLFGWRGAMLIIGGVVAQNIALSLLLQGRGHQGISKLKNSNIVEENTETKLDISSIYDSKYKHANTAVTITSTCSADSPVSPTRNIEVASPAINSPQKQNTSESNEIGKKANETDGCESSDSENIGFSRIWRDLLDISALKIVSLDMYLFACFFLNFGFIIPFVHLPDRAVSLGIERTQAALLISVMAVANTLSRIGVGAIGDLLPRYRRILFGVTVMIGGVANVFSLFCKTFWALAVYSVFDGATIGTIASLNAVILRDCVGLENVSKAIGFQFIVVAFGSLTISPFAGWLYDTTGSYDIAFILTGCFVFFGGLVVTLIPSLSSCLTKRCCSKTYRL